jgi:ATP phosphoribosyltransferase
METIVMLLTGAIEASGKVGLMLNVHRDDLDNVLAVLPALKRPTISNLSDADWVAVNTVIEEKTVREIIPRLKAANAQGIVEYPLNKIVV